MSLLINRYPQLLGIGIDEATALVVTKGIGKVTGRGSVHFYDANREVGEGEKDYESVHPNGAYDLVKRTIIEPGEPVKNERANRSPSRTRPPRPPVTTKERAARIARSAMQNYDQDKDGFLDKDEISRMRQPIAGADEDEDGRVSAAELESWIKQRLDQQRGN